jgi:3-hydroxyisobutyrate dehydrogenase-like beta-hydroxyacid dehydrogenase
VTAATVGFVGLGNMGGALAVNLVGRGFTVVGYDARGSGIAPPGVEAVGDVAEVGRRVEVVVLSLPDGAASKAVTRELAAATGRATTHVVDTSTTGVAAAVGVGTLLADAGIDLVDAPVSGGVAGARARTLAVMYAGSDAACARVEPVLTGLSDRRFRVGDRPGLGQAMKLLNNFLSATALAATSEAVAFGRAAGLDLATMLDVLNASSGRSTATTDKFPDHVLTERYASGFTNSLMAKDVELYRAAAEDAGTAAALGEATAALWARFAAAEPGADFTRVFPFVEGS